MLYFARTFNDTIREAWGIFLLQFFILIVGIILLIFIFRYVRAIIKRCRFVTSTSVFCKMSNIDYKKTAWQYASIFKNTNKADLIIDTKEKRYVVKYFTPSIVKNINLHFITPNRYYITNVKGFVLITRNAGSLLRASFFKPKNIEATFLSLTHTEMYEHIKGEKRLPTIDFDVYKCDDKETENILIINPVPLNIKYINKNKFDQLFGGDTYSNFKVYSTEEFLLYVKRNHSK